MMMEKMRANKPSINQSGNAIIPKRSTDLVTLAEIMRLFRRFIAPQKQNIRAQ